MRFDQVKEDPPYAGWLYGGLGIRCRARVGWNLLVSLRRALRACSGLVSLMAKPHRCSSVTWSYSYPMGEQRYATLCASRRKTHSGFFPTHLLSDLNRSALENDFNFDERRVYHRPPCASPSAEGHRSVICVVYIHARLFVQLCSTLTFTAVSHPEIK